MVHDSHEEKSHIHKKEIKWTEIMVYQESGSKSFTSLSMKLNRPSAIRPGFKTELWKQTKLFCYEKKAVDKSWLAPKSSNKKISRDTWIVNRYKILINRGKKYRMKQCENALDIPCLHLSSSCFGLYRDYRRFGSILIIMR